jgi:uncharacterized protein with ParB-like and HNH nuclease domain
MKAIQATPKEVRKIFNDSYVIPDFQRPYSWEQEQCETLWDDIVSFHATDPANEERYFLGNIVVNQADGGKWSVVDGQQRLTTLLLLIKAFFKSAGTYPALEKCLRILDKRTDELTDELRVESAVLADDAVNLHKIIFDTIEGDNNSKIAVNFRYFVETIDKWRRATNNSADALLNLIDTFLDKIVLLPIECGSDDDALTIFQTINNRGMSLTDADIFKAKLYHSVPESERWTFIENWKQLGTPENAERLFRVLMHIIRAENGSTDKEIGLRAFFTANKSKYLIDWRGIMTSLKKIKAAYDNWTEEPDNYGAINSLWAILETYPNLYWNYPLYVFLHKYGELTSDGEFSLATKYCAELEQLLIEIVKYYFIKGAVHNAVNTVKDTTFKVCAAIADGKDYKIEFGTNISASDKAKMSALLEGGNIGARYLRGFVILASYLNPRQDKASFAEMLWERYDIEHILPREWNHYDAWTQETYEAHLNLLGNLMPLERAKNIKAQNEYLRKKKVFYKDSVVQDALEMVSIPDNGWTPHTVKDKHKDKVARLNTFFDLHK